MRLQNDLILEKIMNQDLLKTRLEQLIDQAQNILKKTTIKSEFDTVRSYFTEDGQSLFDAWKNSSKKLLKSISDQDYNSFIALEKPRLMDEQPKMLKRLIPILKSSLDDLNEGVLGTKTEKSIATQQHYYFGNTANNNQNSTINQTSTNTVNIIKGDFHSLASNLRSHGVEDVDIEELQTIINVTPLPQSPSEYSSDLKGWIAKMVTKSVDGTWQVAVGAAGSLLATGLQQYFGILVG